MADPAPGSMSGRTVVITGSTSGIGYAAAAALGGAGATVLVHGRDRRRTATAAQQLGAAGAGRFVPVAADLGSLSGVRAFAEQVGRAAPGGVHVLLNNAGGGFADRELSPDGVERSFALNHIAVAAVTHRLFDGLRTGADSAGVPSRVIVTSSFMEKRGNPNLDDWSYDRKFRQVAAYCDAKLAALAYSYALALRWQGSGVTVNGADPGAVATQFGVAAGGLFRVIQTVGRPFMTSAHSGAAPLVRLATDPELAHDSGGYYDKNGPARSSSASRDPAFGARVVERTAAVVGVD
ncbi:SDR family NAD(P)-dependent oxidoreductase [Nocardia salmonicida]|uniref:SDR family NAD(P)-dependent oxidoreductase n=1 Tax=Nocardia salmonicida TaxID=53431 RepID=UPI0007A3AD9D|nr:SDR family NAD(P)-dependent oxidoreductase [Nocardia salmonicida]